MWGFLCYLLVDRMNYRHHLNLHPSGLLSRVRVLIRSLQLAWCSLAPAWSSLGPLDYSRTASISHLNPSPPSTSHHHCQPTTPAPVLATTLPSMHSTTPARAPPSSLSLDNKCTHILLIIFTNMQLTTAGPVPDTTPAQASCTIGTHRALLSQKHLSSSLPGQAPMRSPLFCQSLHPLPKQRLPCLPLIPHPVPLHAPPPAPLSSHLLLRPVVLTRPTHLVSPTRSS